MDRLLHGRVDDLLDEALDAAAAAANNPLLGKLALGAALVVGGALAVAFAAMIRTLRRPAVRAAFLPT